MKRRHFVELLVLLSLCACWVLWAPGVGTVPPFHLEWRYKCTMGGSGSYDLRVDESGTGTLTYHREPAWWDSSKRDGSVTVDAETITNFWNRLLATGFRGDSHSPGALRKRAGQWLEVKLRDRPRPGMVLDHTYYSLHVTTPDWEQNFESAFGHDAEQLAVIECVNDFLRGTLSPNERVGPPSASCLH